MKLFRLTLAVVAATNALTLSSAYALDLYVDTKTKQIFAEPGPGRVHMGTFEKSEKTSAKKETADSNAPSIPASPQPIANSTELNTIREDLQLKASKIEALEERVKQAEKVKMKPVPGLHYESKDGNFTASLDGRIQIDSQANVINEVLPATGAHLPNELNSGANIRRARLGVEGSFYKNWDYKFEYDFSRGAGTVAAGITDA